jgi:DNA polymerase III gamma/tau subunit
MVNSKVDSFLRKSFERDSLSQAYLFSGPKETGKFDVVIDFVCLVNNLENNQEAIMENKNPDIIIVEPELDVKKNKKKDISIDQIKEAVKKISYFSYQAKKKFLVIKDAEKMNQTVANSLLKIIEEPDAETIIILIAFNEENILATIRSRCQKIYFNLENQKGVENYLKKKYPEKSQGKIEKAAEFSWGRCKLAEKLLEDEMLLREKEEIFDKFKKALKGGWNEGLNLAEKLSGDKESMIEAIEEWIWYLRIFLKKSVSEKQDKEVQRKVSDMINRLLEVKNKIETSNANERLQLENFFVQMG